NSFCAIKCSKATTIGSSGGRYSTELPSTRGASKAKKGFATSICTGFKSSTSASSHSPARRAISRIRKKSENCRTVQSRQPPSDCGARSFEAKARGRIVSASALTTPSGRFAIAPKLKTVTLWPCATCDLRQVCRSLSSGPCQKVTTSASKGDACLGDVETGWREETSTNKGRSGPGALGLRLGLVGADRRLLLHLQSDFVASLHQPTPPD